MQPAEKQNYSRRSEVDNKILKSQRMAGWLCRRRKIPLHPLMKSAIL
jgi:hypothetical protein